MKECDKRNSYISSKPNLIYIYSNNDRHSVTKTFTPLRYTSPIYTSLLFTTHVRLQFFPFILHPTTLHYTSLSYHLTKPHLNSLPLHFNPHHYTSPQFTSLHFQTIFAKLLFFSLDLVYNSFPNSLSKNFRFRRGSPNASAGSWSQLLMVLFTKEFSRYPFFSSCA